jgi:hypothetical protein
MEGCRENSNAFLYSKKGGKFLYYFSNFQILKDFFSVTELIIGQIWGQTT